MKKNIATRLLLQWCTIALPIINSLIPSTLRSNKISIFGNRLSLVPSVLQKQKYQQQFVYNTIRNTNLLHIVSTKVKEDLKTESKHSNVTNGEDEKTILNKDHHATTATSTIVGDSSGTVIHDSSSSSSSQNQSSESDKNSDIDEVVAEVTRLMSDGFDDLVSRSQNISSSIEDKVSKLSKESLSTKYQDSLAEVIIEMQKDQERQLFGMQKDVEKRLVGLVEEVAFSDTNLMMDEKTVVSAGANWENSTGLVDGALTLNGLNATELRTREILKYWRVAPLYYSVVLLFHWVNKLPGPRKAWLRSTKGLASFFGDGSKRLKSDKDSYAEYLRNAEQMQNGWKRVGDIAGKGPFRRSVEIFRRSLEIWGYFSTFYLREMRMTSKFKKGRWTAEQLAKGRSELGAEVTQNLLKLGPTFIKVGQLFSTRIDIVPKYIDQLRLLQDQVPPFSGDISVAVLESELGKPINEIFDTFNTTSLAAASLGQVHLATKGDKTFAVKVQRQYLRELFDVDLGQLRQLAGFADAMNLQTEGGFLDRNTQRDWLSVYEESKRLLYEEIDYLNEMENCDKFRNNFQDLPFIKVPMTYPEYTTDKVMCMEYCPGIKIDDKEKILAVGLDPVEISIKSAQVFLEQLCRHGFFHCDPHPGNVAVDVDPKNGGAKLIFYDFGMMDSLSTETRKAFVEFLFAFYIEDDVKEVMDALAKLGILREGPDVDRIAVEKVGKDFMDRFQSTLKSGNQWDDQLSPEEKKRRTRERRRKLGEEFLTLNSDVPFSFPPTWTFVFRAFISLDGIGKTLNPKYDLTRISQPYMKELLDLKDGSALKTALLRIGKRIGLRPIDINMAFTQPRRTAQVQDVTKRLEQGDFKLRVRALEAERMLERSKIFNNNLFNAVISCLFLNSGLCITSVATANPVALPVARSMYVVATFFAAQIPFGIVKLRRFEKYLEKYGVKK